MPFIFSPTPLEGVIRIQPQVFWDERWWFMETYSKEQFAVGWITQQFVQDNHSFSMKGVLRWYHLQTQHTQSKLVRVTHGSVYDLVIDLRDTSPTYGSAFWCLLSADNKTQLFIPKWCAHGFLTLEDNTEFVYKCDDIYAPAYEMGIHRASADLHRTSPSLQEVVSEYNLEQHLILSAKDSNLPAFQHGIHII